MSTPKLAPGVFLLSHVVTIPMVSVFQTALPGCVLCFPEAQWTRNKSLKSFQDTFFAFQAPFSALEGSYRILSNTPCLRVPVKLRQFGRVLTTDFQSAKNWFFPTRISKEIRMI